MSNKERKRKELIEKYKTLNIWTKYQIRCVKKDYEFMSIDIYKHLVNQNQIENPVNFKSRPKLYVNVDGTIWYFNPYYQEFWFAGKLK